MTKTVVVQVKSIKTHPKYRKQFTVVRRFKAHNESGDYKKGDVVIIQETRPLSKEKRWKVIEVVRRASVAEDIPE